MEMVIILLGILVIQMFVLLHRIKNQNLGIAEILAFMVRKDPQVMGFKKPNTDLPE